MVWKIIQFGIAFAVIGSNAAYHWLGPNTGFASVLLGMMAAGFVSQILALLIDFLRRVARGRRHQSRSKGFTPPPRAGEPLVAEIPLDVTRH